MDLAILCHCAKPYRVGELDLHGPLLRQGKLSIKSTIFIHPPEHCSPEDTETKWYDDLPDKSIDIMWSRHCPIQNIFTKEFREVIDGAEHIEKQSDYSNVFKNILNDGWRILRANGKVYIPIASERSHTSLDIIVPFMKTLTTNPWKTEIIKIKDSPILISETTINTSKFKKLLGYIPSLSTDDYSHVFVLTKPISAGGTRRRRRHSTRKRKTLGNTRKH